MRILVTRPELQGARTAAVLRARGHDVLQVPLLRIEPVAQADLGHSPWDGIIMTSANASHAISPHPRKHELRDLPVFVTGASTKEAAEAAGFGHVEAAGGDGAAVAQLASARIPQGGSVLYLAGEERAGDLAGLLSDRIVNTVVVYRAVTLPELPATILDAVNAGSIDAALHFSARSVATFLRLSANASCLINVLKYNHFCLSAQVAAPLVSAGAERVVVASRPDETALLGLVGV